MAGRFQSDVLLGSVCGRRAVKILYPPFIWGDLWGWLSAVALQRRDDWRFDSVLPAQYAVLGSLRGNCLGETAVLNVPFDSERRKNELKFLSLKILTRSRKWYKNYTVFQMS